MTNTGREYEALTEQVFSRLLAQSNLCVDVLRDTTIQGRSTAHQIDLSFEFVAGPTKYLTIIQCKDWSSAVKQEQVLAFRSVLDDIPSQPRGIMVSRSGFQEGARAVAAAHGICLYELREPRDSDWEGLIRTIRIECHLMCPTFQNVRFQIDEAWAREQLRKLGLPRLEVNLVVRPGLDKIATEDGAPFDLKKAINSCIPPGPCDWTSIHYDFPKPIVVETPGGQLPRLRMAAVDAEVRVDERCDHLEVNIDHMIAYCFKDVLGGEVQFIRNDAATSDTTMRWSR